MNVKKDVVQRKQRPLVVKDHGHTASGDGTINQLGRGAPKLQNTTKALRSSPLHTSLTQPVGIYPLLGGL